jgi:hypothetical protein
MKSCWHSPPHVRRSPTGRRLQTVAGHLHGRRRDADRPAESEAQDTHFYVDLEGNAARDLYKALKAKAEAGVCGEPGDLTKRNGGVQCTMVKGGKEYHCAFGVEMRNAARCFRRGLLGSDSWRLAIPSPSGF